MIPRDTMTEIPITNENGDPDTKITQLTIAYAYGDGREGSCENTVWSVEKLLSGFSIDNYLAVDTTVVAKLNDAVGGVTVTTGRTGWKTGSGFCERRSGDTSRRPGRSLCALP